MARRDATAPRLDACSSPWFHYLCVCPCLFIAGSSLPLMGFSLVAARGGAPLRCSAWASHCGGFSCCRARAVRRVGFSSCGFGALEHRLSSCGTWVLLPRGMWDLPGPGIEPVSPALAGRFFTSGPPRKPITCIFLSPCRPASSKGKSGSPLALSSLRGGWFRTWGPPQRWGLPLLLSHRALGHLLSLPELSVFVFAALLPSEGCRGQGGCESPV